MTTDVLISCLAIGIPLITAVLGFIIRDFVKRLDKLEQQDAITQPEVRQIIADKVDPLRDDIKDMGAKIEKLFDLYVRFK